MSVPRSFRGPDPLIDFGAVSQPEGTSERYMRDPVLRPFVHAIRIEGQGPNAASPSPYMVLPGPYPVLGIRISGELRVIRGTEQPTIQTLEPSGMTGLQDEPRWYVPQASTRSVLVALRPEGAFGLFGIPMNELMNGELALDHLLPITDVRAAEERVAAARTDAEAEAAAGSLLRIAVRRSRGLAHPVVAGTVAAILTRQHNRPIEQFAREASISRRQLERLFQTQVGMPPKRFAVVVRFAWAAARLRQGAPLSQLATRAGYADQAHFVRTVARFAGSPPTRLLAAADRGIVSQSFNT